MTAVHVLKGTVMCRDEKHPASWAVGAYCHLPGVRSAVHYPRHLCDAAEQAHALLVLRLPGDSMPHVLCSCSACMSYSCGCCILSLYVLRRIAFCASALQLPIG